jgi:glycerophosphoryl diester phosphodiesterase
MKSDVTNSIPMAFLMQCNQERMSLGTANLLLELVLYLSCWLLSSVVSFPAMPTRYLLTWTLCLLVLSPNAIPAEPDPKVLVMAHRGGLGLWPENTLYGYRQALNEGSDVIEIDVWRTSDGVVVVNHDSTVDRTTGGTGPVASFTLEDLQKLDAGYRWSIDGTYPYRGQGHRIPTLDEVLTEFPDTRLNIDLKENSDELMERVCNLIEKHGATDRLMIASFHQDLLCRFRERCPDIATSAGSREIMRFVILSRLRLSFLHDPPFDAFQVPIKAGPLRIVTRSFVETAHRLGVEVHAWTVNTEAEMRHLIGLGVDGIITDYPDKLNAILAASVRD